MLNDIMLEHELLWSSYLNQLFDTPNVLQPLVHGKYNTTAAGELFPRNR